MNQDLLGVRRELIAGKDTERNLPYYLHGLAGAYYRMANYNLAMQYTSFAEAVSEGELKLAEKTKEYASAVRELIALLSDENKEPVDYEAGITALNSMRREITVAMQALTAYTDRLYLHEYVLQRMIPGMEGTVEDIDSYAALEEISAYLFCDEEQEGLMARVASVVAELPIRMTKAKFLEWVRNTASVYKDSDEDTLDRVFYMLYSASGLYEPDGMELFPECREALDFLNSLDYRSITEEQYRVATQKLDAVTGVIASVSEGYYSLMELVNSLMTIFLTEAYVMSEDIEAVKGCKEVYRLVRFDKDFWDDGMIKAFEAFEGMPEKTEELLVREEGYLDEIPVDAKMLDAMMQKTLYTRVQYAKRLHTTSLFVELEESEKKAGSFDSLLDAFCEEMSKVLENGQRAVNRGIMARVIQCLPLPFTRKSDIQKYVLATLENCHDMSEKTAALRAIRELTEGI